MHLFVCLFVCLFVVCWVVVPKGIGEDWELIRDHYPLRELAIASLLHSDLTGAQMQVGDFKLIRSTAAIYVILYSNAVFILYI